MKRKDNLLRMLIDAVRGDPIKKQYERVEAAVKIKAERVSDAEFNRTMTNFYTQRSASINHETHWWEYADAKQKEHDHTQAWQHAAQSAAEAETRADAEVARFNALQQP